MEKNSNDLEEWIEIDDMYVSNKEERLTQTIRSMINSICKVNSNVKFINCNITKNF